MYNIMKQTYLLNTSKGKYKFIRFGSLRLIFIATSVSAMLWGCNFLEYSELDQYNQDDIFYEFNRTKGVLSHAYSYLPDDFMSVGGAMRASASDDAVHEWRLSSIHKFNDGTWSANAPLDAQWNHFYSGIRTVNLFLEKNEGETFEHIRYNDDYNQLMQQYEIFPYEARFLRAFFYFELIKRYRDVLLITDVISPEQVNNLSPSTFDDILAFIVSEVDQISPSLPVSYMNVFGQETGRATRGAAMALKSRVLLYAASPLHNSTNEASKWIEAANAAKAVIDELESQYTPLPAYTNVVNLLSSRELILDRREADSRRFEEANTAVGFIGGNTGTSPTQNLVDSYEMQSTGLNITDPASGYDPANPYEGRDPRLAATVLHNGSTWKTWPVEIWYGGLNGPPRANATPTGYYLKKYLREAISLDPFNPSTGAHNWVIFRYGEILLNYAEAMNEVYGPEAVGVGSLDRTALEAVNIIRARATMPDFPVGMTQADFRDKLRNERRVELAFEDHRFWDIRRWKIGESTTLIYGVDIIKVEDDFIYSNKLVETRVWNDRMYLYPIPQTELFINTNLRQNPGW
jgi:starch-binding outer membrane protein, SusD/RagB family